MYGIQQKNDEKATEKKTEGKGEKKGTPLNCALLNYVLGARRDWMTLANPRLRLYNAYKTTSPSRVSRGQSSRVSDQPSRIPLGRITRCCVHDGVHTTSSIVWRDGGTVLYCTCVQYHRAQAQCPDIVPDPRCEGGNILRTLHTPYNAYAYCT